MLCFILFYTHQRNCFFYSSNCSSILLIGFFTTNSCKLWPNWTKIIEFTESGCDLSRFSSRRKQLRWSQATHWRKRPIREFGEIFPRSGRKSFRCFGRDTENNALDVSSVWAACLPLSTGAGDFHAAFSLIGVRISVGSLEVVASGCLITAGIGTPTPLRRAEEENNQNKIDHCKE